MLAQHLASNAFHPLPRHLQDAEAFEAKRSRGRGERGGEPAWASARVAAKRSAEDQARLQSEIDEDDAFAVREGRRGEERRWVEGAVPGAHLDHFSILAETSSPRRALRFSRWCLPHCCAPSSPPRLLCPHPQLDMAKLALQAEGHELELLAAVEGEGEEEEEEGEDGEPQS